MSLLESHIKPEEVGNVEKRREHTVSIIGCGQIGVLHAYHFLEAGFKVICVDADQTIVNQLAKGKAHFLKREIEPKFKNHVKTGHLNATNDIRTAVSQSSVIAIAIPVKVDEKKKADYSEMENTCGQVGANLRPGSLVILMSLIGLGVTEGLICEKLESASGFKAGVDFGLAYSPVRILYGEKLEGYKRIVAARDKSSLNAASTILETITKNIVRKTENIKAAEVAALFEILQQDVNVALADELALFCERAGADYLEALTLAEADALCMLRLPTLADRSIREEPYLLLQDAENLDVKLRIPTIAREINEEVTKHAVNLTKDALRNCGKTLRRAKISLLGISQIPNVKSSAKKMAKELARMLEARGAKVNLYDPYFSGDELAEMQCRGSKDLTGAVESVDCILILTGHEQFKHLNLKKLRVVMKMPAAIVDLEGIVEPSNVEKEGFIYRGLGRGVWTK